MKNSSDTLFLCRTPLQALISIKIIELNRIENYDVIYFTTSNTHEDILYYERIKIGAKKSYYINYDKTIKIGVVIYLLAIINNFNISFKKNVYSKIFLSSMDNLFFRKIASSNFDAEINTFDDGAANLVNYTIIDNDNRGFIVRCVCKILFIKSIKLFKEKKGFHYTIFKSNNFDKRNVYLDSVFPKMLVPKESKLIRIFIGQPFEEYCDNNFIARLISVLKNKKIDYYIKHPRETNTLLKNIPLLEKNGLIAEELIIRNFGANNIELYGGFSTVMINMDSNFINKYIYLDSSSPTHDQDKFVLTNFGCNTISL